MPFNDLEKKRIENALDKFLAKRRPPLHIRKELDITMAPVSYTHLLSTRAANRA